MTPYQVGWLEDAAGPRRISGRWTNLIAPIITAILVIALGVTVFGLMNPDDPAESTSRPAAAEPARR
jgi:hypothetical protein